MFGRFTRSGHGRGELLVIEVLSTQLGDQEPGCLFTRPRPRAPVVAPRRAADVTTACDHIRRISPTPNGRFWQVRCGR